jgi:hypothetical protein
MLHTFKEPKKGFTHGVFERLTSLFKASNKRCANERILVFGGVPTGFALVV